MCFHSMSAIRATIFSKSSSDMLAHEGRSRSAMSCLMDSRLVEGCCISIARRADPWHGPLPPDTLDGRNGAGLEFRRLRHQSVELGQGACRACGQPPTLSNLESRYTNRKPQHSHSVARHDVAEVVHAQIQSTEPDRDDKHC